MEFINKNRYAQFFTPPKTANFMAGLFSSSNLENCVLLDPGAGIGALSVAFLNRVINGELKFKTIDLSAIEIDQTINPELDLVLRKYQNNFDFSFRIISSDYLDYSVKLIQENKTEFTHAILNPPYKKINRDSHYRHELRKIGIETVNLYSAFTALSLSLLVGRGQLVAILPRSFCNGPYYQSFRKFILANSAVRYIHLFESRNKTFKKDDVLQENIIIKLEKDAVQGTVIVSTSTDDSFEDLQAFEYQFNQIVYPNDSYQFIHIPTSPIKASIEKDFVFSTSLSELDIKVSTGPVVDFRMRNFLRDKPEYDTVPLFYPGHFKQFSMTWPLGNRNKPNAFVKSDQTEKSLYPSGYYCVVRRFSSKEEKRRIIASVVDPAKFPGVSRFAFENHLNVFHTDKNGLTKNIAYGLAVFLNTTQIDEIFRIFNGHTQVNATDLRQLKYPDINILAHLGAWFLTQSTVSQKLIDDEVGRIAK